MTPLTTEVGVTGKAGLVTEVLLIVMGVATLTTGEDVVTVDVVKGVELKEVGVSFGFGLKLSFLILCRGTNELLEERESLSPSNTALFSFLCPDEFNDIGLNLVDGLMFSL